MNTFEFNQPLNADALNENLHKTFNVKINFSRYDRSQLEDYRNLLRTKVHQTESGANFNDLLTNETYQKDKFILGVLNTKIKEMLGEAALAEKATSTSQQKFMGMVLAAKQGKKPASKNVANVAKGISTKAAHDFAATTHKGLPAHVAEVSNDTLRSYIPKAIKSKAAAWDDDKDTARKRSKGIESARKRVHPNSNVDEEVEEGTTMNTNEAKKNAKPDFLDLDKDGNKKEPMKKAAADKKKIDDKKKKAVKEAKMSPAEKAHHHATEYARHHKTGNLDLAMHHKENCEECGGMIQHGPMGECWHMHAGILTM